MGPETKILLIAGFGAVLQELIHWYGLRAKLELEKYQATLRSKWYWMVTLSMVLASGIGTLIWFIDAGPNSRSQDYLLFGFSFPLIIKKLADAYAASQPQHLGGGDSRSPMTGVLRNYLG